MHLHVCVCVCIYTLDFSDFGGVLWEILCANPGLIAKQTHELNFNIGFFLRNFLREIFQTLHSNHIHWALFVLACFGYLVWFIRSHSGSQKINWKLYFLDILPHWDLFPLCRAVVHVHMSHEQKASRNVLLRGMIRTILAWVIPKTLYT